ncbi:MAG: 2-succinyl-6-hydroxy-2,4-cyclohexadiene-1-carboxylate synthase [Bacteroidetes bacterium]|nr:2-succinyl-6-hydroxy-2,4-cyclohexadiene-1-carboxylate synthase [Bacteroidota bacterium]
MIIKLDQLQFNMVVDDTKLNKGLKPIVFIHGFTGSSNDWNFIYDKLPDTFLPVAVDLIGHGKSSSPLELDHYTPQAIVSQLNLIFEYLGFDKIILCGYSMGGRAALYYAAKYPQKISGLILESASKGLNNETEKLERLKNDFILADKIKAEGLESFIKYWMSIPLFETLKNIPDEKFNALVKSKLNNSAVGLSNSLRGFSTGNMNIDLKNFNEYVIPVLFITGVLDEKFTNINKLFVNEFSNAEHAIVFNAGHNTHIENEKEYIFYVNKYLKIFL